MSNNYEMIFEESVNSSFDPDMQSEVLKAEIDGELPIQFNQADFFQMLNKEITKASSFVEREATVCYSAIETFIEEKSFYPLHERSKINERLGRLAILVEKVKDFSNYLNYNKLSIIHIIKVYTSKISSVDKNLCEIYIRNKLKDDTSSLSILVRLRLIQEALLLLNYELEELKEASQKFKVNKRFEGLFDETEDSYVRLTSSVDKSQMDLIYIEENALETREIMIEHGFVGNTYVFVNNSWLSSILTFESYIPHASDNSKFYLGAMREKSNKINFNKLNDCNLHIVFFHAFLYNLVLISTLCSLPEMCKDNLYLIGVIASITQVSEFLFKCVFAMKAFKFYKTYYIFSVILQISCMIMLYFSEQSNYVLGILSRLVLGLVGGKIVDKKFIKYYSKPRRVTENSKTFSFVSNLGLIVGSGLFFLFKFTDFLVSPSLNFLKRPYLVIFIFETVELLLVCCYFHEPGQNVVDKVKESRFLTSRATGTENDSLIMYKVKHRVIEKSEGILRNIGNTVNRSFFALAGMILFAQVLHEGLLLLMFYLVYKKKFENSKIEEGYISSLLCCTYLVSRYYVTSYFLFLLF